MGISSDGILVFGFKIGDEDEPPAGTPPRSRVRFYD